ncbi:MAG: hypothetical protein J7M15_06430 [Anaerolineae bacterium]|nr:hypothetical protein [Anaerolineae bacterium]
MIKITRSISPDADLGNADWLRTMRWDIHDVDPNDPKEIAEYFGNRLAWFLTKPASEVLSPEVRRELEKIVHREGYIVEYWKNEERTDAV